MAVKTRGDCILVRWRVPGVLGTAGLKEPMHRLALGSSKEAAAPKASGKYMEELTGGAGLKTTLSRDRSAGRHHSFLVELSLEIT